MKETTRVIETLEEFLIVTDKRAKQTETFSKAEFEHYCAIVDGGDSPPALKMFLFNTLLRDPVTEYRRYKASLRADQSRITGIVEKWEFPKHTEENVEKLSKGTKLDQETLLTLIKELSWEGMLKSVILSEGKLGILTNL